MRRIIFKHVPTGLYVGGMVGSNKETRKVLEGMMDKGLAEDLGHVLGRYRCIWDIPSKHADDPYGYLMRRIGLRYKEFINKDDLEMIDGSMEDFGDGEID